MLKKRIKLLCALLAAAGILTSAGTPAAANGGEPSVSAKAAVLMTADNSTVLYEKAAEEKLPMASTTKIMTALLTLEAAQAEDRQAKITDEMVRVEGSSMGLKPGNVVTLTALAQGMLLCSGQRRRQRGGHRDRRFHRGICQADEPAGEADRHEKHQFCHTLRTGRRKSLYDSL